MLILFSFNWAPISVLGIGSHLYGCQRGRVSWMFHASMHWSSKGHMLKMLYSKLKMTLSQTALPEGGQLVNLKLR